MTVEQVLARYDFENSVLLGYYGGGNYGDELLLEVLTNKLRTLELRKITIAYQNPERYSTYHRDFGYPCIDMHSRSQLLRTIFRSKNIVIGGGGLWGLDVNMNIFLLSMLLFISRRVFRKRVFLLGVGYYDSTSKLGRVSAWLAGKAADYIVARDQETYQNFKKLNRHVGLDADIAWEIPKLNLESYSHDALQLEKSLAVQRKTLFITLRRLRPHQQSAYAKQVETFIANNQDSDCIVALMEPRTTDEASYRLLRDWQKKYKHIRITDFSFNPLALYVFFRKHRHELAFIGPQFHMIITAYLNHIPFLPITYDNKVSELFKQIGQAGPIPIDTLNQAELQAFSRSFYGGMP